MSQSRRSPYELARLCNKDAAETKMAGESTAGQFRDFALIDP
jgi:hypothetical protein